MDVRMVFVGGEDLLFVVAAFGVDFPDARFQWGGLKSKNGALGLSNVKMGNQPTIVPPINSTLQG
jgi:hypothetical protein